MSVLLKILFCFGLFIISPIIFIAMSLVFVEDGSPTIFVQKRLGKNKKCINIYKIRTMKKSTPNVGTHEVNNTNYLGIGFILRKLKIDELPQIINFLKGELNIIGPRPCLPSQIELIKYRDELNIYKVNPGITGLSQILGYDMSNPKILAKVDALYLSNKSFMIDMQIFLATFIEFFKTRIQDHLHNELSQINNY